MKISATLGALLLSLPATASAICIRPADYSRAKAIASAKIVFVATITEARVKPDPEEERRRAAKTRDLPWYTVQYKFDVAIPIKGDPADVPFLVTSGVWSDPKSGRYRSFAEQSRFVPGDSILVITDTPGEVAISWIPECTDSLPWGEEARDALKATGLWKPAAAPSKPSPEQKQ
jgi:hypothetical protein